MKKIWIITIALFLQGCAIAMGPKFSGYKEIEGETAQLYILRTENGKPFDQWSAGRTGHYPTMLVNGTDIGQLKRGGYLVRTVKPGPVLVETETSFNWPLPPHRIKLNAEAGKRYFVQLNTGFNGFSGTGLVVGVSFVPVKEDIALPLLKELTLSD
jgi:hypothetical protein